VVPGQPGHHTAAVRGGMTFIAVLHVWAS
jgi:hypothetical protein